MEKEKKKVLFIQLRNDYTGSCRVLSHLLKKHEEEIEAFVVTSKGEGFLSNLEYTKIYYNFKTHSNKYLRFILLVLKQLGLFFSLLRWIPKLKVELIYVNTILPFGAALAAKVLRRKVIYHIHETAVRPKLFQSFLLAVINRTAKKVIYVSQYSADALKVSRPLTEIRYNQLDEDFIQKAKAHPFMQHQAKILMLASLNKHKGLKNFLALAKICPDYQFELVISASLSRVNEFFRGIEIPSNLKIYDRQADVHPFYQRAAIVLNLSDPDYWIESFGMTLLEAGIYARPTIAPTLGGPSEIIVDGVSGFLILHAELELIKKRITQLFSDDQLYREMGKAAYQKAENILKCKFRFWE